MAKIMVCLSAYFWAFILKSIVKLKFVIFKLSWCFHFFEVKNMKTFWYSSSRYVWFKSLLRKNKLIESIKARKNKSKLYLKIIGKTKVRARNLTVLKYERVKIPAF
jgi:hypothetical protein